MVTDKLSLMNAAATKPHSLGKVDATKCTCLVFGLTSAAQTFSQYIADTLVTVAPHTNISSCIDDNLVQAKTFEDYTIALEQLFIALRKFRLRLNPKKCTFLAAEAKFLGCIVNNEGFQAVTEYVSSLSKWNFQHQ